MKSEHHGGTKIQSTGWIIDARWYYAPLAFTLGLVARVDIAYVNTIWILVGALLVVMLCNGAFWYALRRIKSEATETRTVNLLNVAQIGLDLLFFFLVMLLTGGGVGNIGHSFFFMPIVVSMIIFGFRGALAVAVTSGLLVFLSVLAHSGVITELLDPNTSVVIDATLSLALAQSGIVFLIYILTGFFGGYISRLVRARDVLLLEQITRESAQVARLEDLTREFDESAKLLVRRDLQLSSANEKLTQLDKMKSEIISVVAHQLRTPLSAIKWTLKMLLDKDAGEVNAEQSDLLAKGFASNERMIALVNDMLEVDRLESGRIKYNFIPLQFEDLVQAMIQSLLPLATQKKIRIEFTSPKELLPKIKVDPDKMRDVLQNLIDNAIKYTKNESTVFVGVALEGADELHFWVKDSGIGIPDEEKDKIFSRFYRADNAMHTATEGSGLGLFIAQSIVKRHAGRVWFESVLNSGTTFHVVLPLNS